MNTPNQQLLHKVINTVVLTIVTALVLGFFSFLGWLGATMIDIKDNQTKIIKELQYKELKDAKTVEVVSKELFEAKQQIYTLESKLQTTRPDVVLKAPDDKDKIDLMKEFEKFKHNDKQLDQYQQHLQQQMAIPQQQIK